MSGSVFNIVTSWPLDSGAGSGVAVVAKSLHRALVADGLEARLISPRHSQESRYLTMAFNRVLFNLSIRSNEDLRESPVVCFDFDGFCFPPDVRFASVNGGILGDIIRFESGLVRIVLRWLARLEKIACHKSDIVFTPSEYCKGRLCSIYGLPKSKVTVMPNGIFFDRWRAEVDAVNACEGSGYALLAVARLYKRKGLDRLIEAWPDILKREPCATLRIVGDGLEMNSLKSLAQNLGVGGSIFFEGDVRSLNKMAAFYAGCDIFCLPSLHETFGLVYLEAMAAGKPVVALNSSAVPEVIENGKEGILVEPEDRASLVDAILKLMGDASLRKSMGEAGMEKARKCFDWPKTIEPLVEWLDKYGRDGKC